MIPFLIRWIHVASMGLIFGGAILVWSLSTKPKMADGHEWNRAANTAAEKYEWLFWLAVGLIVMTGVGNLGAFGEGLPGRDTPWGERLMVKLVAVVIFVLLSLIRTFLIAHLGAEEDGLSSVKVRRTLQGAYIATAVFSAAILFLALSLSHALF